MVHVPFCRPVLAGDELSNIQTCLKTGVIHGDGPFEKKCVDWFKEQTSCPAVFLTPSATAALEMAALLIGIGPGDEVIVPSFTHPSTANAFVLRGAVPVFVDVQNDTCNLNPDLIEQAITPKTKAIVPVHYAGIACEMESILRIAQKHKLYVIEDAAQGILAKYRNRALGTVGHMGALSFHQTKNLACGEGGALFVNDPQFAKRAEIIREKGTNRTAFFKGEVDKYTWVDIGSSYLLGDLLAAYMYSQLTHCHSLQEKRIAIYNTYAQALTPYAQKGLIEVPRIPLECFPNGHIFYFRFLEESKRDAFLAFAKERKVEATFHYIPLHSSPAGKKWGRAAPPLHVTDEISRTLVRLPLWAELSPKQVEHTVQTTTQFLNQLMQSRQFRTAS